METTKISISTMILTIVYAGLNTVVTGIEAFKKQIESLGFLKTRVIINSQGQEIKCTDKKGNIFEIETETSVSDYLETLRPMSISSAIKFLADKKKLVKTSKKEFKSVESLFSHLLDLQAINEFPEDKFKLVSNNDTSYEFEPLPTTVTTLIGTKVIETSKDKTK
jgi:hypothetical protein